MKKPSIVLTKKQAKALDLAWDVLQYGQTSTIANGGDFTKRNERKCQAAARVIGEILDKAGYGVDDE